MDSLHNKNILVTGGAGFIGSTLVRELLNENANVIVYDNFLIGDNSNLKEIKDSIKTIEDDILNKSLETILKENKIEYLFNLAAEPYIPHCYERPTKFFEINANGALNVMLSAKKAGIKRMIQYSSSEVYGSAKQVPMDEHHPTLPLSTYAVSKLAADRLAYTLSHEQKVPVIILRQFNVYGPRETQPYVIPEIITQLSKGNKVNLGNIKARRDFTYVTDAARGAIELIKHEKAEGEVFNMGSGTDYSIEEIANLCGGLMGHNKIEIYTQEHRLRPLDVERLQCNFFKLHELTSWRPKVDFKEGLKKTIDYFLNNDKKWIWETRISSEKDLWKKARVVSLPEEPTREDNIEKIIYDEEVLATILRNRYHEEGLKFITPNDYALQLGVHVKERGETIKPHKHNPIKELKNLEVQEIFYIVKGKIRVDLYKNDQKVKECIINEGDTIILAVPHGGKFLEPTKMIETKQGPYRGAEEKTFI